MHGGCGEVFLIETTVTTWGITTTDSSRGGVQVEDNIDNNENDEVAIMWDILRNGIGD